MANYDLSSGAPVFPDFSSGSAPSAKRPLTAPFLDVPNIHNFRGLSDLSLPAGRRVRPAYLFRSAEPSPITTAGISQVAALGITHVYDLRSLSEIERNKAQTPVTEIPGTTRVFAPVFGPASPYDHHRRMNMYGREGNSGFVEAYEEILDVGTPAYRTVFTHIRDRPASGLLVHCTAGKDRTGVVVALVLDLAGVEPDRIADEYALTEAGLVEWHPRIIEALLKDPALGGDPESVRRMVSAKKENMVAFLQRLHEVWGGAAGYLQKGLGFSEEDVETIRNNVTEPA